NQKSIESNFVIFEKWLIHFARFANVTLAKEYQKYKIFFKDVTFIYDINKQPDFWCIFCEDEVKPISQDERQIV
ncbi:8532_t:CDS:2, partial [Scutellospora calospora]